MVSELYKMMKKRGFSETLYILGNFEKNEAKQATFFEMFAEEKSYYNAYLRVKDLLLEQKLIKFKLNTENDKVIFLTKKGITLLMKMKEIEALLEK